MEDAPLFKMKASVTGTPNLTPKVRLCAAAGITASRTVNVNGTNRFSIFDLYLQPTLSPRLARPAECLLIVRTIFPAHRASCHPPAAREEKEMVGISRGWRGNSWR